MSSLQVKAHVVGRWPARTPLAPKRDFELSHNNQPTARGVWQKTRETDPPPCEEFGACLQKKQERLLTSGEKCSALKAFKSFSQPKMHSLFQTFGPDSATALTSAFAGVPWHGSEATTYLIIQDQEVLARIRWLMVITFPLPSLRKRIERPKQICAFACVKKRLGDLLKRPSQQHLPCQVQKKEVQKEHSGRPKTRRLHSGCTFIKSRGTRPSTPGLEGAKTFSKLPLA